MRAVLVAADVAMGLILGIFVYAAVSRLWPSIAGPTAVVVILVACVGVVLVRKGGSLAGRRGAEQK